MFVQDAPKQYRVPGEAAPLWIAIGMALLGALGSLAVSWLVLTTEPWEQAWNPWLSEASREPDTDAAPSAPTSGPLEPTSRFTNDITGTPDTTAGQVPTLDKETRDEPISAQSADSGIVEETAQQAADPTSAAADRMGAHPPAADVATGEEPAPTARAETSIAMEPAEQPGDEATDQETTAALQASEPRDCAPLFTLSFTRGSTRPKALKLEDKIARLREWLSAHPEAILLVEGHTDAKGLEESNLLLSYRRATTVAEVLAAAGVPQEQLATRAYGEYQLLEGLPPESEKNRRVTLRVAGAYACPETGIDENIP